MLEELRNINYTPTKEGIAYFLFDVIGNNRYSADVIKVLCTHAQDSYQLYSYDMLRYGIAFNWICSSEDVYYLSDSYSNCIDDRKKFFDKLINDTVKSLFAAGLMTTEMFIYELEKNRIKFRNELFSLEYSAVRNMLIDQGLFELERMQNKTNFYLTDDCSSIIGDIIKRQHKKNTLEQLKKKIMNDELAGELAEKYVLNYERKRLPESMKERVRIISDIDVSAGYDIISYESHNSTELDRFIEVKAVNKEIGFYWSENEYEVAKLKGEQYYLYLVSLAKIEEEYYSPIVIRDPANIIMDSDDWLVETQSYRIRFVSEIFESIR